MTNKRPRVTGDWLDGFRLKIPAAYRHRYGAAAPFQDLEGQLQTDADAGIVSADVLRKTEDGFGAYGEAWPNLSQRLGKQPIKLPIQDRRQTIQLVYERLKHIEVVSVILRFMYPATFGIFSPPVARLLCLTSGRRHVDSYERYLDSLEKLREQHRFTRVASVEMSLWAAVELGPDNCGALWRAMDHDERFQAFRFGNLLGSAPRIGDDHGWHESPERRLRYLAEATVRQDPLLAGLLAARSFEELVRERSAANYRGWNGDKLVDRVQQLEPSGLGPWHNGRCLRNGAVHEDLIGSEVTRFVALIRRLEPAPAQ